MKRYIKRLCTAAIVLSLVGGVGLNNVYCEASSKKNYDAITEQQVRGLGSDYSLIVKDDVKFVLKGAELVEVATDGEVSEIRVPEGVESLNEEAFYMAEFSVRGKVYLPASLNSIPEETFVYNDNLSEIIVSEDNKNYCSEDGVLFSKNMKKLLAYPASKKSTYYKVPDEVEEICVSGLEVLPIKRLYLGENVKKITDLYCDKLTQISMSPDITEISDYVLKSLEENNIEVICKKNTNAAHFCVEAKLNVSVVDGEFSKGDANLDGKVNLEDVALVLRAALNLEDLSEDEISALQLENGEELNLEYVKNLLSCTLGINE